MTVHDLHGLKQLHARYATLEADGGRHHQVGPDHPAPDQHARHRAAGPGTDHGTDAAEQGMPVHGPPPDIVVDRPVLAGQPSRPATYGTPLGLHGERIPLFDGPPAREQSRQGGLYDCGWVAAFGAVAGHQPDLISNAVRQLPDGRYEVTLHEATYPADGLARPTGRLIHIVVEPELPVRLDDGARSAYLDVSKTGVAWAGVLEKALAGVDQGWGPERLAQQPEHKAGAVGYERLQRGSNSWDRAELLTQLTGMPAGVAPFDTRPGHEAATETMLRTQLAAHRPVLVGVSKVADGVRPPHNLFGGHAYEVVSVDHGLVRLRNPWGVKHPTPMTVREFLDSVGAHYTTLADIDAVAADNERDAADSGGGA
jgi:hypothetical protein